MAKLVGGFLVPHVPLIAANPNAAPAEKRARIMKGYATMARRLKELAVDSVVIVGDDHYTIFGPQCLPRCLIGIGDVDGPIEPWLNIERRSVPNDTALALHIMNMGFDHGVDWAVSKSLTLDHSVMIPYHFGIADCESVKTVPIYLSCAVEPLLSSHRARYIGGVTGDAIRSFPSNIRVAVVGTGGMSHWVGMEKMGEVNEAWDERVLDMVLRGDVAALVAMEDAAIVTAAGNGALEIKNWIFALAALKTRLAEMIVYEPVREWVAGFGFVELKVA